MQHQHGDRILCAYDRIPATTGHGNLAFLCFDGRHAPPLSGIDPDLRITGIIRTSSCPQRLIIRLYATIHGAKLLLITGNRS